MIRKAQPMTHLMNCRKMPPPTSPRELTACRRECGLIFQSRPWRDRKITDQAAFPAENSAPKQSFAVAASVTPNRIVGVTRIFDKNKHGKGLLKFAALSRRALVIRH